MTETRQVAWREALLQRLLVITVNVGAVALFAAFVISPGPLRLTPIPVVVLIALLGVAAYRPSLPYRLRAGLLVGTMFMTSLRGYCAVGFQGSASVLAALTIVLTGLLFGRAQVALVVLLEMACVLVAAIGMMRGVLPLPDPHSTSLALGSAWSRSTMFALFIWMAVGFAVAYAVEQIEKAAHAERAALQSLREEQGRREDAERQRKDAEQVAQQAQKLELVGQLAAGVAHDFNNLLAVVQCWAELGAKPSASEGQRAEARASILAASKQGAALARQLLTIGSRSTRSVRDVSLDRAVDAALHVLQRVLPEDIDLYVEHAGTTAIKADEMDVQQVVLNLVVNARDAMQQGGRLRVTTGVREVASEETLVGGRLAPGRWAFLAVEDTGSGIDPAVREHIFEPFFTTKPQGSGTGLGLATVLHIARESGGAVGLDSEPGRGARFTFYWPAIASELVAAAEPVPPRLQATRRRASVLVVEDNVAIRQLIQSILEEAGHRVLAAADGHRALQIIEAAEPVDLLCTDGVLPGKPAPTIIAAFEAAYPGRPVLVVSGYVQGELTLRGIEQGRYRLLRKPFTVGELSETVREMLEVRGQK
jgi:signal transduction histidine kinase/ActR/RegA family two-component response regulator